MLGKFYSDLWNDMNWFGRIAMFPFLVLMAPILIIIVLGFKE